VSQICFYLDEDTINAALVKALRNANLNLVTVADAGRLGYSDEEQSDIFRMDGDVGFPGVNSTYGEGRSH
jgi:hypothetical protein